MAKVRDINEPLSDDDVAQATREAFAHCGLTPQTLRVSCDAYGVPTSYLESPIVATGVR